MSTPQEQIPQARPTAMPKRWPLVNQLQTRNTTSPWNKDARLINCYAEYDPEDKEYWVYKRFGISALVSDSPLPLGYGMYTDPASGLTFKVVSDGVANTSIYYSAGGGVFTLLSSILDSSAPYFFTTVNSNPQIVVFGNSLAAYSLNMDTLAVAQLAGGFPNIFSRGFVYLDGTLYVMTQQGNILGSNINDPSTWNGLNTIPASSNSDLGVALFKQLSYVIALKQNTTQVLYDAGNTVGSPLSPVPDAQIPLGCVSSMSVQSIDNSLLWMTSNETASPQIVMMSNLTPQIVSTPAIERILDAARWGGGSFFYNRGTHAWQYTAPTGLWSWVFKHAGHRFYGLSIVNLNLTLVYDLDQQMWYVWKSTSGSWWPVIATAYLPTTQAVNGLHYVQNPNGQVYTIDTADVNPNDAGTLFPVDIYTPNMDFGTDRRKYLKAMYFNADKVPSYLTARYSDDDYNTWSNPRIIDLNLKKPRLTDCGTFDRRRAYHFNHLANTALRVKTIDLQMDLGTL